MDTIICKSCKRELPISEFTKTKISSDGYKHVCKECEKRKRLLTKGVVPLEASEDFKMFSSRQLLEELYRRGYRGKLSVISEVDLSKL